MATVLPNLPALVARRSAQAAAEQVLRDAIAATHDPDEQVAYRESLWLVAHPETRVNTAADYPNWTPGSAA